MIHPPDCDCSETLGCRLRREGGVQLNTGDATSTRRGKPADNGRYNGWERGIAGEQRKGGFMPYLDAKGEKIPMREHVAHRHHHHETRRRQHDQAVSAGHHH